MEDSLPRRKRKKTQPKYKRKPLFQEITPESYLAGTPICVVCKVAQPAARRGKLMDVCGDCHEAQLTMENYEKGN